MKEIENRKRKKKKRRKKTRKGPRGAKPARHQFWPMAHPGDF
jgi:hypothetical protein